MSVFGRSKGSRQKAWTFAFGGVGFFGAGVWVGFVADEVAVATVMGCLGLVYFVGTALMLRKELEIGEGFVEVRRMGFRRRVFARDLVEWGVTGSGSGVLFRYQDDRTYWICPEDFEDREGVVRELERVFEGVPRIERGTCPGFLSGIGALFEQTVEFEADEDWLVACSKGGRLKYAWSGLESVRVERNERHGWETLVLQFRERTVWVSHLHFNYDEIRALAMESRVVRRD